MRGAGIIILAASLCAGCGFMGGTSPERENTQATTTAATPAGQPAAEQTPEADTPPLAAARALWKGVHCTDARKADTQLTALLASSQEQGTAQAEALALRGLARSELGMKEEAFEDLTTAVRQRPVARNYAWRALALLRNGNARGAQVDAHYALRKDSAQPVAHLVLGLAALQGGDAKAGCSELQVACKGGECSGLDAAQAAGTCPR